MVQKEIFFHVTVLSNFSRGFDKYANVYCKENIPESTYPDRFFLLRRDELAIGVQKATRLLKKLGLPQNRLIALATEIDESLPQSNESNGQGMFIRSNRINLTDLYQFDDDNPIETPLRTLSVEEAMAASLRLLNSELLPYKSIRPRAISFLPVAIACQAKCQFCFSKASISSDQSLSKPNLEKAAQWVLHARQQGAERAVITGGGEPTLLPFPSLQQLIATCAGQFEKIVLITNGHNLALMPEADRMTQLEMLSDAGLRVLAISRHHFNADKNQQLMNLRTPVEALISTWRANHTRWPHLRLRLICVLQKGGIENDLTLEGYLSWAMTLGVDEICFKELYVSTSVESIYHNRQANEWSRAHQVSLSLITQFAERHRFTVESRLPWGAPIYHGQWLGKPLRIAAYTEPSLFWERTQGVARSWNVMADGRCYASLEDRASEIAECQ